MPVTIPADGAAPSYSSQAASAFSSRNAVPGIEQPVDALAGRQLAARAVALDGLLAAAARHERRALAQLGDERLHPLGAPGEGLVALDLGGEQRHETEPNEPPGRCR